MAATFKEWVEVSGKYSGKTNHRHRVDREELQKIFLEKSLEAVSDKRDMQALKVLAARLAVPDTFRGSFRMYVEGELGFTRSQYKFTMVRLEEWGALKRIGGGRYWEFIWPAPKV